MSVEFAQQTELARINKHACQTSTSMQTQLPVEELEEEEEEKENEEEQTPVCSPGWLHDAETERLERELRERNAEIRKLREELQKTKPGRQQVGVSLTLHYHIVLFSTITYFHLQIMNLICESSLLLCHSFF